MRGEDRRTSSHHITSHHITSQYSTHHACRDGQQLLMCEIVRILCVHTLSSHDMQSHMHTHTSVSRLYQGSHEYMLNGHVMQYGSTGEGARCATNHYPSSQPIKLMENCRRMQSQTYMRTDMHTHLLGLGLCVLWRQFVKRRHL
jgi:hypothetical protein